MIIQTIKISSIKDFKSDEVRIAITKHKYTVGATLNYVYVNDYYKNTVMRFFVSDDENKLKELVGVLNLFGFEFEYEGVGSGSNQDS